MCYCFGDPVNFFFFWRLWNYRQITCPALVSGPPNRKPHNKYLIASFFSDPTVDYGNSVRNLHNGSWNRLINNIIISRSRVYESITHEAEGRMGYWLRGHEGERNNWELKLEFNPFLQPKIRRSSLLVGYNIQPSSSSANQKAALIIDH